MLNSTIGLKEILIVAVAMFVLFSGKRLPKLGRRLGESIKELKNVLASESSQEDDED